ncbi:MAG: hypothetical protein HFJ36_03440 [Clostridia bacterium]|nr:hypothetical protein [Clostridia bacterium]
MGYSVPVPDMPKFQKGYSVPVPIMPKFPKGLLSACPNYAQNFFLG